MQYLSGKLHRIFCENVRDRRTSLGLTQQEVADRLGVDRVRVTETESGRFAPTLDFVERISKALEVDPAILLQQKKSIPSPA